MVENIEHKFASVNGIKLHYVTAGKGPLVILLHGFPEFWYSWRFQIPALSKHYTVVAPDLRGYGDSDKPKGVKSYGIEMVAADIAGLIRFLGASKAHVVGHDWGGATAMELAQRFPQCVDKLVILNCPFPQNLAKSFLSNFSQIKKSWYIFFYQIPLLPEYAINKNMRLFFLKALRGWAYNKAGFPDETIDKYVTAMQKPRALSSAINYYRAAGRNIFHRENRKINSDTLVIWGENDKALGKELTLDMQHHITGKFDIRYLCNCSHWVHQDNPDAVNKYLIDFLTNGLTNP